MKWLRLLIALVVITSSILVIDLLSGDETPLTKFKNLVKEPGIVTYKTLPKGLLSSYGLIKIRKEWVDLELNRWRVDNYNKGVVVTTTMRCYDDYYEYNWGKRRLKKISSVVDDSSPYVLEIIKKIRTDAKFNKIDNSNINVSVARYKVFFKPNKKLESIIIKPKLIESFVVITLSKKNGLLTNVTGKTLYEGQKKYFSTASNIERFKKLNLNSAKRVFTLRDNDKSMVKC